MNREYVMSSDMLGLVRTLAINPLHPGECVDERVQFSIGSPDDSGGGPEIEDDQLGVLVSPQGLAFDDEHGRLFVVDGDARSVVVFSADDGSFVSRIGRCAPNGERRKFKWPAGVAVERERLMVVDTNRHLVHVASLAGGSCLCEFGAEGSGPLEFQFPHDVCVDGRNRRIVISDTYNHRVQVVSSVDYSFLFEIGREGEGAGEFRFPRGLAIDHALQRLVVADSGNHRLEVLSLLDGSFLFEIGRETTYEHDDGALVQQRASKCQSPYGVCIDNHGRLIVAEYYARRLQAFTCDGEHIGSFPCPGFPTGVSFDKRRGVIAFSASAQVHVIAANQWLPHTFSWRPERHRYAPDDIRTAVWIMTMVRTLTEDSLLSVLPTEMLFEVYKHL